MYRELPDVVDDGFKEETAPTIPEVPTRRRSSSRTGIDFMAFADEHIVKLRNLNTRSSHRLADEIREVVMTMDSWRKCEPTPSTRFAAFTALGGLAEQARSMLNHER